MKTLIALCLATTMLLGGGCVYTHVRTKDNAEMTRLSLGGNQQAQKVNVNNGTLEGYSSEQAQAAAAMAEGIASGIAKALTLAK